MPPITEAEFRTLTNEESRALLASQHVGRIAFTLRGGAFRFGRCPQSFDVGPVEQLLRYIRARIGHMEWPDDRWQRDPGNGQER